MPVISPSTGPVQPPYNAVETLLLEQAIREALASLPPSERREYDQAMAHVPHLVQSESPIEDFLWTENYYPKGTALRLARYWKARKHVFGEDRWLLPLNQTGQGALKEEELDLIRSGYFVVLKRPEPDGGIVNLVDKSRLTYTPDAMAQIRLMFYLTTLYAKDCRRGLATIHLERGIPRPAPLVSKDLNAIFNVAMPIKLWKRKVFVVQACCFEPGREALVDFLFYQTAQTLAFNCGRQPGRIVGNSIRETRTLLQEASGVETECLPTFLGGTYDYRDYGDWIRQRLTIESVQMVLPRPLLPDPSINNDHPPEE